MSKGILQPDGTHCYAGATCKRHGNHNVKVLAGNIPNHADLDPNLIFTGRHASPKVANSALSRAKELMHQLPLKEMEASLLTHAILDNVMKLKGVNYEKVAAAVEFAAYLHRDDTRANRKDLPRTPYIEHPLRNTLRGLRYGVKKESVTIANILHDTVEDHAWDIARQFAGIEPKDEHDAREIALNFISEAYGKDVAYLVNGVSNPIYPSGLSKEEKRGLYATHVKEVIEDPDICTVKFLDLGDNAFGLHHNDTGKNSAMIKHLALKYDPVLGIMANRLERDKAERKIPVSDEGFAQMLIDLENGHARIRKLAKI
jgi:(p)ppGpp synthase/HD superfamily hydrolase